MPRIVVLGCGTGVGKTRSSSALLRALRAEQQSCIGLKPIESGLAANLESHPAGSDAQLLSEASSLHVNMPHPLYAFREPVSPHLAARGRGIEIAAPSIARWVEQAEREVTPLVVPGMALWCVIETAGGVFSPLSSTLTNFELARALEPAIWILVAADALGALHDVSATLQAMRARGRVPDHLVLSAAREPDASTGTNANELRVLQIATVTAVLERNDDRGIRELVQGLRHAEHPNLT